MDSNYQWQKQRANERHSARMREAQAHRLLQEASTKDVRQDQPGSASLLLRLWRKLTGGEKKEFPAERRRFRPRTAKHSPDSA